MRLVPEIVTLVPVEAAAICVIEVGVKLLITGRTVKDGTEVAVPPGVVTEIFPVSAPVGIVATITVPLFEATVRVEVPSLTEVAPLKFVPLMVTELPTKPNAGVNPLIVGEATMVIVETEVATPHPLLL